MQLNVPAEYKLRQTTMHAHTPAVHGNLSSDVIADGSKLSHLFYPSLPTQVLVLWSSGGISALHEMLMHDRTYRIKEQNKNSDVTFDCTRTTRPLHHVMVAPWEGGAVHISLAAAASGVCGVHARCIGCAGRVAVLVGVWVVWQAGLITRGLISQWGPASSYNQGVFDA